MKGVYAVFFDLKEQSTIEVGALGKIDFELGTYVYVGSAMTNAEKRIDRHFSEDKKDFWHVDYFSRRADAFDHFLLPESSEHECILADAVSELGEPVENFGCSDCGCESHLFRIYNLARENFT